jgi:LmbE family N-acetylglucosaminyl deacetylase
MDWIYLSPHLDDAALSCGGLISEQSQAGDTTAIWTMCAGDPPPGALSPFAQSLHARWGTLNQAADQRRSEDLLSCQILGANAVHFSLPDCIYRQAGQPPFYPYASESSLFGPVHPGEMELVERLSRQLASRLPEQAEIVAPLALGGHVDHRLTRFAAERLAPARRLSYYADYPYVLNHRQSLTELQQTGWTRSVIPVSPAGLGAWQSAIAAHASQISTFWPNLPAMQAAIEAYWQFDGGVVLWQPPLDKNHKLAFSLESC